MLIKKAQFNNVLLQTKIQKMGDRIPVSRDIQGKTGEENSRS